MSTDDAALRKQDNIRLVIQFAGSGFLLLMLCAPIAVSIPIARAFAGRETVLTVSVTVVVSIALAGVVGVLALILRQRNGRLRRMKARNDTLRKAVHELRKRLKSHNLDASVTPEVQAELDATA